MQDTDDLLAHERTYHAFNMLIRWSMAVLGAGILWLTIWFASPAGFWGATAAGFVAFVLAYIFLIRKEEHQPMDTGAAGR
jgi:hypothetical protein